MIPWDFDMVDDCGRGTMVPIGVRVEEDPVDDRCLGRGEDEVTIEGVERCLWSRRLASGR
ncbi:MAG: hypothetical protein GY721_02285 [Deltaproteobacteria bacterium]|nr:hypothetical protein [Deltaproteobacteria bacterium]